MMNIFVNTTTTDFLDTTIPYKVRKHGNVFTARLCYATAFLLFQENKVTGLDAIRMLDKALELTPNFLDADQFRQEIWHGILTPSRHSQYSIYLNSPAWHAKKIQVLERDAYRCALCNTGEALEVHHKTYDNIGREPLEDLTTLCAPCHSDYHTQPLDPYNDNPSEYFAEADHQKSPNNTTRTSHVDPNAVPFGG